MWWYAGNSFGSFPDAEPDTEKSGSGVIIPGANKLLFDARLFAKESSAPGFAGLGVVVRH